MISLVTRLFVFCIILVCSLQTPASEPATGWRGNGTGLWPDTTAPVKWNRTAHGAIEGLRIQANTPQGAEPSPTSLPISKGLLPVWLVSDAVPVSNSIERLDDDLLAGEAQVVPEPGKKLGEFEWTIAKAPLDDPMIFGTADLPWMVLKKSDQTAANQIAYAHTYLFSPRGGPVRGLIEHSFGAKVFLNGEVVYKAPRYVGGIGGYQQVSRLELAHEEGPSGRFEAVLKSGWNRILVKVSTDPTLGHKAMHFCLRVMDPPDVKYTSQNIRWMSELPGRSTSTPILVEDKIFLTAEPDQLVCVDKKSGQVLWTAANNYYEALSLNERLALPALNTEVAPLVEKLKSERDRQQRLILRKQIQDALIRIDPKRFSIDYDGHFAAHFGIVGFTMPSPVTDGEHVYVWCGMGVAACYDLGGKRKWITRVPTEHLEYGSSPSLADGMLAVFLGKLYGIDAKTGQLKWTQPRVNKNIAAVTAATLNGHQVFVSQLGEVIRPADGEVLFRPRTASSGDGGCWGPPVVLGNTVYSGKYGVKQLNIYDYSKIAGNTWKPELKRTIDLELPKEMDHRADGSWLDRSTAGSPLIHQGLAYAVDIYGWLYVSDVETGKTIYFHDLKLDGLMHYNAVPIAASATLIGKNIVVFDNQGNSVAFEPGREYREITRNRIETILERVWPIPGQETLTYAPPIADADCFYLRGEQYLYCIGETSK